MPALKGSKTEENLKAAFAGESQANRRYLYFANKADVEGQNDVAALFRSTAEGETGHAHGHLEWLEQCGDPATGLPIGSTRDNLKAAVAGGAGHAGIHVGVFVGLTGDGGLQVGFSGTDRQAGGRVAGFFQEFQMAVGVAGLAFRGGAEQRRDVVLAFHVGLVREVQVAAVGLGLAGERGLQGFFCL